MKILELAIFKLAPGTGRADFLREVEASSLALNGYPGFLERTLYHDERNNQWFDILMWDEMESALTAAQLMLEDEQTQGFLRCLQKNATKLYHGTPVHRKVKDETPIP